MSNSHLHPQKELHKKLTGKVGKMTGEPAAKKQKTESQFDQLKALTTIVADTGDVDAISKLKVRLVFNMIPQRIFSRT